MSKTQEPNYQQLQTELEQILLIMQSGELAIDEALPVFKRGQQILNELEKYLKTAENEVIKLSGVAEED